MDPPPLNYLKVEVEVEGSPVLLGLTVNNASGTVVNFGCGTATHSHTLGDPSGDPALSFAHLASTLTLALTASGDGWQAFTDERWGFDTIAIRYTPADPSESVPGPVPAVGLAPAFGFSRRRRRRLRRRAARSR